MFLQVYLAIQIIAMVILLFSVVKLAGNKSFYAAFLGFLIFTYLAFASFNIQTSTCNNTLANETVTGNVTTYAHTYDCQVNVFTDINQVWFNASMALICLVWGIALIFVKQGDDK